MVPIQFEYETTQKVWNHDRCEYEDRVVRTFVVILHTFKHHYSDTLMYKIRQDTVWPNGNITSDETIVTEAGLLNVFEHRIKE